MAALPFADLLFPKPRRHFVRVEPACVGGSNFGPQFYAFGAVLYEARFWFHSGIARPQGLLLSGHLECEPP